MRPNESWRAIHDNGGGPDRDWGGLVPSFTPAIGQRRVLQWRNGVALLLVALIGAEAQAQQPPPAVPDAVAETAEAANLSSTELGRTEMGQSFTTLTRRQRISEERRHAFRDIEFKWELRSYDFDKTQYNGSQSAAWAAGGSAGFTTGYFRELAQFGATGYTSQPVSAPAGKAGTQLLQPDQTGYTVLGEAFARLHFEDVGIQLGRSGYDTPYLNRNDSRMTPQTFEGVTLIGAHGGEGGPEWRYGGGYISAEKQQNSQEFISMAKVAGASVDRGVYVAGASYKDGDLSIGAIDYYSRDIINIAYTELSYAWVVAEDRMLLVHAQYTSQSSVGEDLLTGSQFSTDQFGVKTELRTRIALLSVAYTVTGRGADMRSPWSGYPGYTSVQLTNFNRAGENALMLRAATTFEVKGLSAYALWVHGYPPVNPKQLAQDEYDANLQWTARKGALRGLALRLRYAYVTRSDGAHQNELRIMLSYAPPK